MATYTVADIQSRVAEITSHSGFDADVIDWINLVTRDMATRVPNQLTITTETIAAVQNAHTYELAATNAVQLMSIMYKSSATVRVHPLKRKSILDFYKKIDGHDWKDGTIPEMYFVRNLTVDGGWGTNDYQSQIRFQIYPVVTAAYAAQNFVCVYAYCPEFVTASGSVNQFILYHYSTVVSGVLRFARLALGDVQGYQAEKVEYERGISDMIIAQTSHPDRMNVMRSAENQWLNR